MDESADSSVDSEVDPLAAAIAALGEPLSVHQLSDRRKQWLMLTGLGLIFGGIILLVGWMWLIPNIAAGIAWKFLITPIVLGFILVGQVVRTSGVTIYLFPQGLLRTGRGKVESFLWDELEAITIRADNAVIRGERHDDGRWASVWFDGKAPLVRTWHSSIELRRADGTKLKLSPVIDDYAGLSRAIQQITFAQRWPNVEETLAAGGTVPFGPFSLSNTELISKKNKRSVLADWKKTRVQARFLWYGKKTFFSVGGAVDLASIEYPHLFIAALHDRVGGLVTEMPKPQPDPTESEPAA